MKRNLAPLLLLFAAGACWSQPRAAVAADPPGWQLVWNDEFEGATLDASKWTAETTTRPHNNERQAYLPEQITVAGGHMVITAANEPYQNKAYRSGRVHSNYTQHRGRWEVRADLPTSRGMWPAIWLLPDTEQYNWPSQGEIDILENRGNQTRLTSSAFHYGTSSPYTHQFKFGEQTTAQFGVAENFHTGFHTYAVEWDAKKVRFFVDDVHHLTIHDSEVGGFLSRQTAPMWTVLNTAVGGDFLAALQPDGTTQWPQQFLIDYVRVYDRSEAPLRLRNGRFELNDGSAAHWTVFGNRLNVNNVAVHNEATAGGKASLKLFGQSTGAGNYSGVSQGITVAAGDEVHAEASTFIRSQDSIAGTGNTVQLKIEFYNEFGGKHGTPQLISEQAITIANAATANDGWRPHQLVATAPAGAIEARLALVFMQPAAGGAGAVHIDDVCFRNLSLPNVADADGNGVVDGADMLLWQRNVGRQDADGPATGDFNFDGAVDSDDLSVWKEQSAAPPQGAAADDPSAAVVPEPRTTVLALTALAGLLSIRPLGAHGHGS